MPTQKGRTAEDYSELEELAHIYKTPGMFIGSVHRIPKKEWIFDLETKTMKQVELDLPQGVKRIALEIISNAGDNSYFSRTEGYDPGTIDFSWNNEGYLTVENGGLSIPIEPDKKSDKDHLKLLPEKIFSQLRVSTNYDEKKDRIGCGRNGYGSKLTNIFSKHFIVEIGDSGRIDHKGKKISGQEYMGEWKDNMSKLETSTSLPGFKYDDNLEKWVRISEDPYEGKSYVRISWKTDFDRFDMKKKCYSKEEIGLFCRYVIDFSVTCGVPVTLNGEAFDYRSIRDFVKLFFPEDLVKKGVSHFCASHENPFPKGYLKLKTDEAKEKYIASSQFIPESQIFLLDTPDNDQVFSYANGLISEQGGVHVDKIMKELFSPIVKHINDKHKGSMRLTQKDVKPHITIFLICRLVNIDYDAQNKTIVTRPVPNISFSDAQIKTLLSPNWSLLERLENTIGAKNIKGLTKTDGKKTSHVNLDKAIVDANKAGKAESLDCSLYVVEGLSASSYPEMRIDRLKDGKDLNGVYPLQGKPMNVTTHNAEQIAAYKEFENIKKMLGLRQGMDYSLEANYKTLRYGRMIITTDADSDGMHILGLIINLFHKFWPTLFERGFVCQLITPVVRVYSKGKKEPIRFYDEHTFTSWFSKNGKDFKGDIMYYKGLGTSDEADIDDDMNTAPIAILEHDEKGRDLVNLAFDKNRADERKDWITEWRNVRESVQRLEFSKGKLEIKRTTGNMMGISFPPYMIDNLFRSIPSINDGFKKAQRKVLYYALHFYKYGSGYVENLRKPDPLVTFGAGVISHSKYHHGDKSLYDTIVKMGRNFYCSNNIPVMRKYGSYGTRSRGGKNSADPRYLKVSFPWWYQYAYDREMVDLVPRREVDGELAEPLWVPCDIPIGIINGSIGVATGWKTYIPPHHPIAVIDWILDRLESKKRITPLTPFFNGFKGNIEILIKTHTKKVEDKSVSDTSTKSAISSSDSDIDDDEIELDFVKGRGFYTQGVFEITKEYGNKCDVTIKEIPVAISIADYMKFIKKLYEDGCLKEYRDLSSTDSPHIELTGLDYKYSTHKGLKLESDHPLTNMVMIDDDGIPKNYASTESILAGYVEKMLLLYQDYKASIIGKKKDKISELEMELRIIVAYLDGKLVVHKKTDEEVDANLEKLELSKKIFDKINLRNLTQTRVDTLKEKIATMDKDLKEFEAKSIQKLWSDRLNIFKKEFLRRKIFPKPYEESIKIETSSNMILDGELSYKKAFICYS